MAAQNRSFRSDDSAVSLVKPTRTMRGKALTPAQDAARDARNAKLRVARAAKKEMMSRLPVFGTVVPNDGTFVPEASQNDDVLDAPLIQPISTLGTLIAEQTFEASETDEPVGNAHPDEFVEVVIGGDQLVPASEVAQVAAMATVKKGPARKTDRRWNISEQGAKANAMFRALRKAGLVCGDSGSDPAIAVAKAAAEGKIGAVTATQNRSEWGQTFTLLTNAPTQVAVVLDTLGYTYDSAQLAEGVVIVNR